MGCILPISSLLADYTCSLILLLWQGVRLNKWETKYEGEEKQEEKGEAGKMGNVGGEAS